MALSRINVVLTCTNLMVKDKIFRFNTMSVSCERREPVWTNQLDLVHEPTSGCGT